MYPELLNVEDICYTIKNEIFPLILDSDFEDMYKSGGRPPVRPSILVCVTIMQFLEKLSDRAACTNLKFRMDWKIAFNLPIDFLGFHPTTLHYFRDRLVENKKASYAFDKVLDHLVALGLIKKNKKQRIDSTHIIANVKELSRLELMTETLRVFCQDIEFCIDSLDANLQSYRNLYLEKMSIRGISDAIRNKMIVDAGIAMKAFIELKHLSKIGIKIQSLKSYGILKTVFEQNFIIKTNENESESDSVSLIKISTGKEHISSPHESEAEYANKGKKGWIGYKAQIAETISEDDNINFITHAEITPATTFDGDAIIPAIEDLQNKGITPSEIYGDTHYNTKDNIEQASKVGVEIKGPVAPHPTKETQEKNKGFSYDKARDVIVCPMQIDSKKCTVREETIINGSFPQKECSQCDRADICKPEIRGKQIQFRDEHDILKARREMMETRA
ncbi:MAG: transposase [Oligoflexia bacterium]|nr:transposase [Oligoflexia bacterium]